MLRITPKLIFAMLCGTMLVGCAAATSNTAKMNSGDTVAAHAKKDGQDIAKDIPTDLDGGVRQAQLLRVAGHYDDAIRMLSQLMLVASDDPRVVSEYGKALAEKGRAQDAVEFLNRAIELSANDWTLYSALGVSYDQLGDQTKARTAYEHALALHPEEPSVLNNYALSRMLAGDTDGAHTLIARAQNAGGASDSKIAANIAMLNKISPTSQAPKNSGVAQSTKVAEPTVAQAAPQIQPPAPQHQPVAQNMPRPIIPNFPPPSQQQRQIAITAPNNGVVMQPVPFDPYAGPVGPHSKATSIKLNPPVTAKLAGAVPQPVSEKPDANGKTVTASAKTIAKTGNAKDTAKSAVPVSKTAQVNPAAKPLPVKVDGKDQIPALRMSANAY